MNDKYSLRSPFSSFLNRFPEALVVKCRLRATPQKRQEGDKLMDAFLYRLQKQAHQLSEQDAGGFACPILVSFKQVSDDKPGQYLVAVTFNLLAFGAKSREAIKKQVMRWIASAWASVLWVGKYLAMHLVRFSSGRAFLCLIPGSPQYRDSIEALEHTFAGLSPGISYPDSDRFHHLQGFFPYRGRRARSID